MLSLKKICRDELLQLALILSLLRVRPDAYFESELFSEVNSLNFDNGTSWRSVHPNILRSQVVHPKNLDSMLLNYEREVFADLNSLGRYNRKAVNSNVTAYLLNIERTAAATANADVIAPQEPAAHNQSNEEVGREEGADSEGDGSLGLSQEDMDLIEILWKQDVDLGFSMDGPELVPEGKPECAEKNPPPPTPTTSLVITDDDVEKLKTLKAVNDESIKTESENGNEELDPWASFDYTIDTETGEYVIKGELHDTLSGAECGASCDLPLGDLSLPPLPEFLLEEALQLVGLDEEDIQGDVCADIDTDSAVGTSEDRGTPSKDLDSDEDLDLLADMIQTSQFHHPHHRAFQSRMPFVRTVSMEQRWQDLANLLSLPSPGDTAGMPHPFTHHHPLHNYSHPHPHTMGYGPDAPRGVLLHNATLTPPVGDLNATVPYGNLGGTNLGNAVATSMNLTNSSEPLGEPSPAPHYKMEPSHEMMYYHNGTSEMNQTDGFLSAILNDEDLQLMDMAMNEGMYTMRMLDSNNAVSNLSMNPGPAVTNVTRADVERMDTSSDSAVSSMGSERVPSLSDGEWCDAGSDSGHTTSDHYVSEYGKYRPYDYSYTGRQPNATADTARLQPVAQKKHHMFGKRCFQEGASALPHQAQASIKYEYRDQATTPVFNSPTQTEVPKPPELKYSCSMEFGRHLGRSSIEQIQHNHTYHLPAESTGAMQRPVSRDKPKSRKAEDEHLTRDEKRARSLSVPISVDDIINLPMDEFNERLSKYDLSEAQLSLIRDIRRRGKNKVAAQNCRKRKLDQILSLADEVKDMRDRKMRLLNEHEYMLNECKRIKDKYQQLYRHVFQNLRDPEGNHYSPYQYSLQISADGSILIVPRANSNVGGSVRKDPPSHSSKE